MGLFEILGTDDPALVGNHLKTFYVENSAETKRRAHSALLDQFYEGKGDEEMERVIDMLYKDSKNAERRKAFIQANLWLSLFPGLAIFVTVLGFNLFGDGLRDALDPRLK